MTTSVCNEGTFTWSQENVEQRNLNRSCSKDERKKNEHTVPLFINANLLPLNFLYNEIYLDKCITLEMLQHHLKYVTFSRKHLPSILTTVAPLPQAIFT